MTNFNGAIVSRNTNSENKAKKNLRICAGWCKRMVLNNVPGILTNQYLWDLNCGALLAGSPARKSKGISGKCNQVFKTLSLVTGRQILGKKNLRIRAGWCNSCDQQLEADITYQYLWDFKCSSGESVFAMSK
ncbi:UNVERIFIED_ORG: hypothetical protein J2Y78_000070 [Buttiauxella agrestis ATCC 33320]